MSVSLQGDFDRLGRLIARAGKVASPAFWTDMVGDVAGEVSRQIGIGFSQGRDPYRRPWQPLRTRQGQPLVLSGRLLKAAQAVQPTPSGVMVTIDLVYAATQQYGARIRARKAKALRFRVGGRFIFRTSVTIPARPFLPDAGLPPDWSDGIAQVVDRKLSLTLAI